MTRMLLLAMAVLGVAAAVAIGSYTALAGSSAVGDVAGAVIGHDESDGEDGEAVAEDAAEGDEASIQADGETGEGAEAVAQAIADAFDDVNQEDVLALHEEGIGFGAIFKLYTIAEATGVSVQELLASMDSDADGEFEFAFGKRFKDLTEEQRTVLESGPKNLGQLVSASNHPDEDGEADADAASQALEKAQEKFAAKSSKGNGPPDGVPAHGRN